MEAVVKVKLTRVNLTYSVPGRSHQRNTVKCCVSLNWRLCRNGRYNWYREKLNVDCRTASVRVITSFHRDHAVHNVSAQLTKFEDSLSEQRGLNTQAELTRADESWKRARNGERSLKQGDLVEDHEAPRAKNYRSPKDTRAGVAVSQARKSDSFEEGRNSTKGSSVSWAKVAGARCPLSTDEEESLSADVQDMLRLESQKTDLEEILGREPTVAEWADHCNTSIIKLYARIGKGRAAKRKMIAANLPLVNSVAQQFHGRGLSHWELCQEGVQGLERSAEKYNTSYNTKFSSYSFLWIWERMSAGVKKFRNVLRISRTVYEMAAILLRTKEEFQVLHGRSPSLQELADLSHIDADKIRNVTRLVRPVKSMDESVSTLEKDYEKQVEDQNLGRVPWAHVMESELKTEVAKALQCLTSREQMVLEMRYGLCGEPAKGRAQVGLALDLTYESIRLIEKRALNKLRQLVKEDGLQQYLSRSSWVH